MAKKVRVRNERLKAVRDARRWTQKEMAKALEAHAWEVMKEHQFACAVRKLQSWEAGVPPEKVAVRVLISCLGRTAAELGLEPDPEPLWIADVPSVTVLEGASVPPGLEDAVRRREFVTTVPAVFAAPALVGARQHLGMDDVTELHEAADRLRVIDNQIGGDHLHQIAGRYLQKAMPLLEGSAPEHVRSAMHSAIGGLAADAGWYAVDAADHPQARVYLNEALSHARMAGDSQLEVRILNSAAIVCLLLDRPQEALRAARLGRQLADAGGTPRVKALMAVREARAWALLGEANASRAAADSAGEHIAAVGAVEDDHPWVRFVDEGEIRSLVAHCDRDLGSYQSAAQGWEYSITTSGAFPRNQALGTAHLAHARLGAGEVEGACLAASEAARCVADSSRTRNVLTEFATKLSGCDAPAAREFVERWRASRATTTVT